MYKAALVVGTVFLSYKAYCYIKNTYQEDAKKRPAEQVIPEQEKKEPTVLRPSVGKPADARYGYVASALTGTGLLAHPLRDVPEDQVEGELKRLNIANRYLYG